MFMVFQQLQLLLSCPQHDDHLNHPAGKMALKNEDQYNIVAKRYTKYFALPNSEELRNEAISRVMNDCAVKLSSNKPSKSEVIHAMKKKLWKEEDALDYIIFQYTKKRSLQDQAGANRNPPNDRHAVSSRVDNDTEDSDVEVVGVVIDLTN